MKKSIQKTINRTFKDSKGKVVIVQKPNLPLTVAGVATFSQNFISYKVLNDGLTLISFGALFTWAWLEIFEGANYFRRALGIAVIITAIASRV